MLWFICLLNYADRQVIFSVFPLLEAEFGFDKVELGLIGSAFMWVYAGAAPVAGMIGDRVRRKHLILGGCLFWSGVTFMTGWCSKLWQFVTVRAAEGFAETFYFPASMSVLSDYHDKRTRSRAMSLHQSSVYAGTILGSWIGALFASHWGWRSAFYLFGAAGIILSLALYKYLREPAREVAVPQAEKPTVRAQIADIGTMLSNPAAIFIMLGFVAANLVATVFLTWTPLFLVEKFGFKLAAAGLSGSVFIHLASALSVPLAGLIADKLSRRFAAGRLMVQMAGLLVGATFVYLVGSTESKTVLIVAMTLFGICKGFYDSNIFAALYDVTPPQIRASAAGLMNTVGWGGGALGPLAVGWLSEHGSSADKMENMSQAIASGSVVYLVGAVFLGVAIFFISRKPSPGFLAVESAAG